MPKVSKPKFRCQYKTVGLTYSQCSKTREELRDFLLGLSNKIEDYYIAQETHKDGNFHLHVWFNFCEKPNIRKCTYFDFDGFHPNVGNKKRNWIFNYLKKQDKNPCTNIADNFVSLALAGNTKLALEQFAFCHPKEYAINYARIKQNLKDMGKRERPMRIYPFTGETYEWDMEKRSLLIVGPKNIGKTQWAKSFVHHHLHRTFLYVTHLDGLKKYDGEDFIIFDDVSFKHLPMSTQKAVCEVEDSRDVHCRHVCASIPPGITKIFLHNEMPFAHCEHNTIMDRRVVEMAPLIRFY